MGVGEGNAERENIGNFGDRSSRPVRDIQELVQVVHIRDNDRNENQRSES